MLITIDMTCEEVLSAVIAIEGELFSDKLTGAGSIYRDGLCNARWKLMEAFEKWKNEKSE